jgi:peptidoglycan L-alanyl-D-glutamate endopeptidase CwlK
VTFLLSQHSLDRLAGVHPMLESIVKTAITLSKTDFTVVEGVRSLAKQREYFLAGKSKTMNSRHLTGHAVDLMPYGDFDGNGTSEGSWELKHFYPINDAMQQAAAHHGAKITWGGSWASFLDAPHFELDPARYPFT